MRICIDMGHTPASPGAGGQFDELAADREVGKRVIAELERRGHTVYNSTAPDSMAYPYEVDYRCNYANARDIDLFCSIHFNAAGGGAHGTEVLYYAGDSTGYAIAKRLSANVAAALGTYDRGAKANDWVGVIKNTNATAVLIETCFCDSAEDAALYWACPWDRLINAICDGIEGNESEDDMTEDQANEYIWRPKYDAEATYSADGKGTGNKYLNVWNMLRWIFDNGLTTKKQVASIATKVDKLSAGGATVDYDKLATAVADKIASRMKE